MLDKNSKISETSTDYQDHINLMMMNKQSNFQYFVNFTANDKSTTKTQFNYLPDFMN